MKKNLFFSALLGLILLNGCSKDDPDPDPVADSYMSLTAGNSRTYSETENNPPSPPTTYTITAANRDTTIGGKVYSIFNTSFGDLEYYNITGNDYFTYEVVDAAFGTDPVVNLYLKANATPGTSWTQSYSVDVMGVPADIDMTNTITASNLTRTVNGTNYSNVIHVTTTVAAEVFGMPVTGLNTDIQTYYAPKVGMIENINVIGIDYMGVQDSTNTRTILTGAVTP